MHHDAPPSLIPDLERLECNVSAAFVLAAQRHDPRAAVRDFANGKALFVAPDSPMNAVKGVAVGTPVTAQDLDDIASFFRDRASTAPVAFDVCPLADDSLISAVAARAWPLAGFEQVLWRTISPADADADTTATIDAISFAPVRPDQTEECALLVARIFSGQDDPPQWHVDIGRRSFGAQGTSVWGAAAAGRLIGAASMSIHATAATLAGAAVLPDFRGRGIQQALLTLRIRAAARQGCTLAKVDTKPGTTSQRNAERLGFRLAYTRAQFLMPVR